MGRVQSVVVTVAIVVGLGFAAPAAAQPADVAPASHGFCSYWNFYYTSSGLVTYLPSTGFQASTHCIMRQGAQGLGVKALQRSLVHCYGRNTGGIDGIWGSMTTSALVYAQGKAGVTPDGVYGPQTRNAIKWPRFTASDSFAGCGSRPPL